ncbi:hypothetical protein F5B18DRAFT_655561 [Nemania serpens]|nr:hypothetical protein F5B18DRAFT_655561 [Nemania serpens]
MSRRHSESPAFQGPFPTNDEPARTSYLHYPPVEPFPHTRPWASTIGQIPAGMSPSMRPRTTRRGTSSEQMPSPRRHPPAARPVPYPYPETPSTFETEQAQRFRAQRRRYRDAGGPGIQNASENQPREGPREEATTVNITIRSENNTGRRDEPDEEHASSARLSSRSRDRSPLDEERPRWNTRRGPPSRPHIPASTMPPRASGHYMRGPLPPTYIPASTMPPRVPEPPMPPHSPHGEMRSPRVSGSERDSLVDGACSPRSYEQYCTPTHPVVYLVVPQFPSARAIIATPRGNTPSAYYLVGADFAGSSFWV